MTLQEYIDTHGLSQKDAAAKFELSEAMISLILSKQRRPGAGMRYLIKQKTKGAVNVEDWT